ncbi:MAG: hypothetical protein HY231_09775 [Acidobacteria bacterium]|nr:hypothetical protein [Acidobacteriota bacterium]
MMMRKEQNGIAKCSAAQLWRERQLGGRAFFGQHLQPSSQPSLTNIFVVGVNTINGIGTEQTLFSDYRSLR